MSLRRYYIRAGATTTAGGTVKASSQFYVVDGSPLAREGDAIDCPACNTQGYIECVTPRIADSFAGKQYALSDDLCICQCSPPPKLIPDQGIKFQVLGRLGRTE